QDAAAQEPQGVGAGEADVGEAALGHAGGGEQLELADDLDADEVDLGPGLGLGQQEQALAEADLQLDGAAVAEHVGPAPGRRRVGRVEQVGREGLQRQAGALAHRRQPPAAGAGMPAGRFMVMPMTSPWKTMLLPTNPWMLKMVCRRCSWMPLPTSSSRSPG